MDPSRTPPADQSIRSFLAELEAAHELLHVKRSVSCDFGVSSFLALTDDGPALVFDDVAGHDMRLAGNLLSSRARIARALGVPVGDVLDTLVNAVHRPVPPELVAAAPCQELVEPEIRLDLLPVPRFFERETGPYITAGMIIARDVITGRGNASFARLKVLSATEAFIGIAPNHHLARMARRAAEVGRPFEVAVVIGAHPAIQLAACLYLDLGDDELENAGALLGEPVRLARAVSIDLDVPADAELVIEGTLHPDRPVHEGWVSEFHGMYEDYGDGITFTATAITRRRDAIFQVIQPGYFREHLYLAAVPIAAGLKAALARVVPNVADVAVVESGAGRTQVVVSLHEPRRGQAKRAMFACWAAVSIVKQVTVVDDDIDVWDAVQVEWAKATRLRAERDLVLVEGVAADRSEPMERDGMVTKIGFDATRKPGDRAEGFELALPPSAELDAARTWLKAHHPEALGTHPWVR